MTRLLEFLMFLMFLVLIGCSDGGPLILPNQTDTKPPRWHVVDPPFAPPRLFADSGNAEIYLCWYSAFDDQSPPVFYLLYMDTDPNPFDASPVIVHKYSYYTFKGLTNGRDYWFGVRASDSATPPNVDDNTQIRKQTPKDPGPDIYPPFWNYYVGIDHLIAGNGSVEVFWGRASDERNSPVHYLVYMDTDDNPFDQIPIIVDFLTFSYKFVGLVNGQDYWFGVRSSDSAVPWNIDTNTVVLKTSPYG